MTSERCKTCGRRTGECRHTRDPDPDWSPVQHGNHGPTVGPTVTLTASGNLAFNPEALELLFDEIEDRMEVELVSSTAATMLGIRQPVDGAPKRMLRKGSSANQWFVSVRTGLKELGLPSQPPAARRITPRVIGDVLAVPLKEVSS